MNVQHSGVKARATDAIAAGIIHRKTGESRSVNSGWIVQMTLLKDQLEHSAEPTAGDDNADDDLTKKELHRRGCSS
jgi:hypothetical protein